MSESTMNPTRRLPTDVTTTNPCGGGELADVRLHYVHADAAPREIRRLFARREPGPEDERERIAHGEIARFVRGEDPATQGDVRDLLRIHAAPVVFDLEQDLISLLEGV